MKWGLTRRNEQPEWGIDSFRKEINQLFNDFFSIGPSSLPESAWMPTVDVEEDDREVRVRAEIPGIEEKDLSVTLENDLLTIAGEKKEEKREENRRHVISERRFGSFHRTIRLPEGIDREKIEAGFKNGVLRITIPRVEAPEKKRVKIALK
ncbi:MAG TPA: Hsp20/alpha crystallin family protein [Spirochaetota bacterium]|nr:MAG: Spore protein SP21 [Spirochaetes bacterium ADurb.BinA120]HNU92392.1 Hsp20/alpha crystallin family protein [Spirochaetota bacterium]HPI14902.1 Hsp20/alpha crystallin family protein [Spirochaetota bacterium]HPO46015.1 Hsp20/alpha crystallin family protein [Spirochaetota bacterium]